MSGLAAFLAGGVAACAVALVLRLVHLAGSMPCSMGREVPSPWRRRPRNEQVEDWPLSEKAAHAAQMTLPDGTVFEWLDDISDPDDDRGLTM
jgi:hypothetical protein